MKEIEEILNDIKTQRACGNIVLGIKPRDKKSGIGKMAAFFGLKNADTVYQEIPSEEAFSILVKLLNQDMAYGTEILSLENAHNLTSRLEKLIDQEKARFYTNRKLGSPSWSPATNATFDGGLLILENEAIICIWFEDED